jgi:hypothetical protein
MHGIQPAWSKETGNPSAVLVHFQRFWSAVTCHRFGRCLSEPAADPHSLQTRSQAAAGKSVTGRRISKERQFFESEPGTPATTLPMTTLLRVSYDAEFQLRPF